MSEAAREGIAAATAVALALRVVGRAAFLAFACVVVFGQTAWPAIHAGSFALVALPLFWLERRATARDGRWTAGRLFVAAAALVATALVFTWAQSSYAASLLEHKDPRRALAAVGADLWPVLAGFPRGAGGLVVEAGLGLAAGVGSATCVIAALDHGDTAGWPGVDATVATAWLATAALAAVPPMVGAVPEGPNAIVLAGLLASARVFFGAAVATVVALGAFVAADRAGAQLEGADAVRA